MENHLINANRHYLSQNYIEALSECEQALKKGDLRGWVYARKGLSLFKLERFDEARGFLKEAIKKGVRHKEVLYCYAYCIANDSEKDSSKLHKELLSKNKKHIFRDWGFNDLGNLKKMLDVRLYEIYKADNQKYKSLKNLLIKNNMNVFMREKGYLVPKVHFEFKIGDNLSLNKFPKKFVVKPIDGFNSNGVYVVENGVDLFRRIKLPRDFGRYLTSSLGDSYFNKEMIVEELIDDVDLDHDPYLKIPRDFKVFVADGKVYWINVYNRNARGQLRSMVSYDPSWERIPQMTKSYLPGVTEKKPNYFDEMLVQAENISREYPFFLRLDFYLSKKGPVFGEFTPFPGDFINATDFGLRTMSQMVRAFPD